MYINKIILYAGAILLVGGGLFLFFVGIPSGPSTGPGQEERGVLETILAGDGSLKAVLEPSEGSGSSGSGLAYKLAQNGRLYHAVQARMEDPSEGAVYEGWLVQPEPLRFFSTGVLELNEQGEWALELRLDEEYPTYTRAIITEETLVDDTPERHILEGDFF